jgi:biopolymer transport protein TolR
MKLKRRAPPPHSETIVALIDVVFFLLVFFILVGRMDATAPFDLVPPVGVTGSPLPGGGMTLAINEAGEFAIDGRIIDHDAVVEKVKAALGKDANLLVRINADRNAELRRVMPVVSELEGLGAKQVVLIVTPNPP